MAAGTLGRTTTGGISVQMFPEVLTRTNGIVDVWTKGKAEQVGVKARQIVPVKTGALRGSIKVQRSQNNLGRFVVGYEVSATKSYAWYVHDGTRYMAPRPFLLDAARLVFAGGR